ncbi:MAG: fused MFS/spermidine synthase [Vicinamibacterales bacterium]|mgnify:CR=1 FL=1
MTITSRSQRWSPALLLLFVGSGAAALIYEIVWLQLLQLFIGSSSVSMGVLLGTFMGGMCLGSLLLPRLVSPLQHPLRVYAFLEIGIAVFGVLLLFLMPLVGRVYLAWGGYGLTGFLLRGVVAAVCLLPPTLAMGATLPAVARWVKTTPEGISWLGFFYAGNIAGAVFGSLLAGFYLLRVFDMATATYVAVGINAMVAAAALTLASATDAEVDRVVREVRLRADPTYAETTKAGAGGAVVVYVAIALSGFCALAGEVIWTRLLGLLFGATVYTFSIILAVFLIGLGIGSSVGSMLSRSLARPRLVLGWCQLLVVAAIAWTARTLTESLPYWPVSPTLSPDIWLSFEFDFVRTLWAILPPAVLWGASFPLALASVTSEGQDPGRLVGRMYAANTIGAVVGSLAASLLLVAWIGSQRAQQAMMALSALAGLMLLVTATPYRLVGVIAAVVLMGPIGVLVGNVKPVPGILVAYGRYAATVLGQTGDIFYVGEGLNSSVAVSRLPSGTLGYHNAGKIQASSQPEDMRLQRMLGHLTTLVPKSPRSVLVIGCGAGVTAGAVSISPLVERVTIAEIEPLVPQVVSKYFGEHNYNVVGNPKVRIQIDDARHFLLTSKEKFDGITSDPLDPWVKGAATLYTKEFFEAAKAHLNPGGVVTLFVQLYESTPEAVKSEVATFFDVFPTGFIAGNIFRGVGYDMVLVGQAEPIRIDLDDVDARLKRPEYAALAQSLREIGITSAVDLFATYAGRATDLTEWMKDAIINRDSDLRLQYLAGLGLERYESDRIYGDIIKYRRFPDGLFTGSDPLIRAVRQRIEREP